MEIKILIGTIFPVLVYVKANYHCIVMTLIEQGEIKLDDLERSILIYNLIQKAQVEVYKFKMKLTVFTFDPLDQD